MAVASEHDLLQRAKRGERAALREKTRTEFDADPYLRDIVERNLEVAAQCRIDISNRIISLENARKPHDYHEAIVLMGELGVMAPIAGFRHVLVHEYVNLDWEQVYANL